MSFRLIRIRCYQARFRTLDECPAPRISGKITQIIDEFRSGNLAYHCYL